MTATIFVHLTDTHITARETDRIFGIDSAQNLRDTAAMIRRMALDPAFILITGDLANHGEPEAYARFKQIVDQELAPLGAPIFYNLGNHDHRANFRAAVLDEPNTDNDARYYYRAMVGDVRVIMLDSKFGDEAAGELGAEQLAWLKAELATPAPGGTIIGVHHPPHWRGVPRLGEAPLMLRDIDAFAAALDGAPVLGVFSGHTHVFSMTAFAGTISVTTTATAFLGDPSTRDGGAYQNGAGFTIGVIRDGRLIVNPVTLPGPQTLVHRWTTADLERARMAATR
ncbi:MAG: metallophosphoesterase [Dehalococcoidia bacterium]|nr:metallophosphoesterase [Dehalococcoidia bacterium]